MPNKVIYRELEEMSGITLEEHLNSLLLQNAGEKESTDDIRVDGGVAMQNNLLENPGDYLA